MTCHMTHIHTSHSTKLCCVWKGPFLIRSSLAPTWWLWIMWDFVDNNRGWTENCTKPQKTSKQRVWTIIWIVWEWLFLCIYFSCFSLHLLKRKMPSCKLKDQHHFPAGGPTIFTVDVWKHQNMWRQYILYFKNAFMLYKRCTHKYTQTDQ